MQKQLLFLFITTTTLCFSQKKKIVLKGLLKDKLGVIKNANILNLNTKEGTFSNHSGIFSIAISVNDVLQISSVQHHTQKITISNKNIQKKRMTIKLYTKSYVLNEIEIKKHNLSGNLLIDIKKTPKDTISELVNKMMDGIKSMKLDEIMNMPTGSDEIHLSKSAAPGIPNVFTDGIKLYSGTIGGSDQKKRREERKKLEQKEQFPDKLLQDFGDHFFYNELKVPKDKYYHFIEYCSYTNVASLYYNKKIFEVIELLKKESIQYLKIINKK